MRVKARHHHRLPDLFERVAIADAGHFNGLLEFRAVDIGHAHIGRHAGKPISIADLIEREVGDGLRPLARRRVNRNELRIDDVRVLNPIDLRFDIRGLLDQEADRLLRRDVVKTETHGRVLPC